MTSETPNSSNPTPQVEPGLPPPKRRFHMAHRALATGIVLAVLAVGAAGGVAAHRYTQRWSPQQVLLMQPAPIGQMKEATPVAIKGAVAEVFGNKFIVQDDSGRALVDTGPQGEGGRPVAKDETVTVQGRFDRGVIHAQVMVRADGSSEAFGPPRPPHRKHGPHGPAGPRAERGPGPDGGGPDRGPRPDRGPPQPL